MQLPVYGNPLPTKYLESPPLKVGRRPWGGGHGQPISPSWIYTTEAERGWKMEGGGGLTKSH